MRAFSNLLDRLIYTRSRNGKLDLIARYLKDTPDPDRGWAMAALTGELDLPGVKPAAIRGIAAERVDPVLLSMSYDYVGDLAETVALIWTKPVGWAQEIDDDALTVSAIVTQLMTAGRSEAPAILARMLDHLDANGRFALLKLATGGLRIGISARLARTAFAQAFALDLDEVEEHWHAIPPPYTSLFDWAEGRAGRPEHRDVPLFRPFMLAHPLGDLTIDLARYAAEWKWDGIRIQLVGTGEATRLYSRGGDDVTGTFPEVAAAFAHHAVLDGELLVRGDFQGGEAASFNALQQRLGRKKVSANMLQEYPAFVRLYDI
ncbi:MAG: ATP-dependent DNA ligase, partial [Sphingomonadaceae bacterium]